MASFSSKESLQSYDRHGRNKSSAGGQRSQRETECSVEWRHKVPDAEGYPTDYEE